MRKKITPKEFLAKEVLREDEIFRDFKPVVRSSEFLYSFEWKAEKRQGKFVPVP